MLPDGNLMKSSHTTATLLIPFLPAEACAAHIFPTLASGSLISIGQLCDHECTATFTAKTVTIKRHGTNILTGSRSPTTRLWSLDFAAMPTVNNASTSEDSGDKNLPCHYHTQGRCMFGVNCRRSHDDRCAIPSSTHTANAVNPSATIADRIEFYHASMGSPALSTWCDAIDAGRLTTFPELTSAQVRRYPPASIPMIKGHLDQQRANLRSTKSKPSPEVKPTFDDDETSKQHDKEDMSPTNNIETPPLKTQYLYADCASATGKIFTDQTGRFLTTSSKGNSDMLILYEYDSNFIHVEPMKNKSGPEILAAYQRAHKMFNERGLRPLLQKLDNEASEALQQFMTSQGVDYQLAPPLVHRRNAAERSIRTFKNHFIATLCSTDKDFPLHLWDRLLPQALMTLNLLRGSRINPSLSAWAQVYGAFDYNRTPLAPPGTRVLVHDKPATRGTCGLHMQSTVGISIQQ